MQEAECAYVIILMAVYWCTEVLPLAVTSLLPAVLFPLFGIMESKDVSKKKQKTAKGYRLIYVCVHLMQCECAVSGVCAVPKGHEPVVRGRADGGCGRGALESAQAHSLESAARRWCASSAVSSDSPLRPNELLYQKRRYKTD